MHIPPNMSAQQYLNNLIGRSHNLSKSQWKEGFKTYRAMLAKEQRAQWHKEHDNPTELAHDTNPYSI